ncbi:alpha-mannosidase [Ktedonobacteria bacterium brp13]|nr:alpha-mannosidase [Ktedonobacteria bacterium brp13]
MFHQIRWTIEKISQRLNLITPLVYRQRQEIAPFRYHTLESPRALPPVGLDVDDSEWAVIEPHTYWGRWRTDFVLRTHFTVPADWDKDAQVALSLPIGDAGEFVHPEALAYIDGASYASCDRNHREFLVRPELRDGQKHLLVLHGWTGMGGDGMAPPDLGTQLLMRPCEVVVIDQPTRELIAVARVAVGAAQVMSENTPARGKVLAALDRAFTILDTREPFGEDFYKSVPEALAALRGGIAQAGAPLDVEIIAAGHAHIDVAWLWPLGQTRRKASRTFTTALRLMEQFPDYHFTQSTPQLYEYVRQDHPEVLEEIKHRVSEGRWEVTGGMWVEADCNLSGPESLARQFLLGRSFFAEHFGGHAETNVLWLPDVFGYAWALPQLLKESEIDYFFTIKIAWSQYNKFPYHSFWWQGIDGTRVLTHFSPSDSGYNAMATPKEVLETWENFRQKDIGHEDKTPPVLLAYGYGDGGGGPTREMLENLHEMAQFPALPRVRQEHAGEFFRNLEESVGDVLPTWNGELYLELHRGTYTTQARNKRSNRKSEFLLHDAEFLATQATLLDTAYAYPYADVLQAWRLICLNQFHDIIPGSSINEVYVDSTRDYQQVTTLGEKVRDEALRTIATVTGGDLLLANTTSFERGDLAFWSQKLPAGKHLARVKTDEPVYTQTAVDGTWIATDNMQPASVHSLKLVDGEISKPTTELTATSTRLENRYVRIEINTDGDIIRVYDKINEREVLPKGAIANQFQAFEDRPMYWDAWDIDIFYDDKQWLAEPAHSIRVVETGPLRATLEIQRRILHSNYTQYVTLNYNSPRLDIATKIDWRERHILLKAAFPVDILNPVANYEIQWGNVQRPTHRNTSWDYARFEVCAQKWIDLSEGDYGVSLLNDCKYGHDVLENVMRISLLRSPKIPDPEADQGEHHFTYSLFPHAGSWNEETIRASYLLNDPLLVYTVPSELTKDAARQEQQLPTLFSVDKPNIVIETVKVAEDGNGIIVRLYESQRSRGKVTLTVGFEVAEAYRSNILEHDRTALTVNGHDVTFSVHPFEIVTLRIIRA